MMINFYRGYRNLPFSPSPRQPEWSYDPGRHPTKLFDLCGQRQVSKEDEIWLSGVLAGMNTIKRPITAHVAVTSGRWGPGSLRFQFTTLPKKDGLVKHLWHDDFRLDGIRAFRLSFEKYDPEHVNAEYWRDFFEVLLQRLKQRIYDDLRKKQSEAAAAQSLYNEAALLLL